MTAHHKNIPTQKTADNRYNPYNFEAKARFSQYSAREFSHPKITILKGIYPDERSEEGGELSC